MTRVLTILFALALAYAGARGTPRPLETPDGFAATPLWLEMKADGSLWFQKQELNPAPGGAGSMSWAAAMERARQGVRKDQHDWMAAQKIHLYPKVHSYTESLFEGWVRIAVDPQTPFLKVWELFMGADRDYSVHKFAFEFPGGGEPVFVRMPWDFGLNCGVEDQESRWGARRLWLIQWLDWGELGFEYEGVRHALGEDFSGAIAVDTYHPTAQDASAACRDEKMPGLLVEDDVPWSEVVEALRLRKQDGVSWWPVPRDWPGYARMVWAHEVYVELGW